MRSVQKPVTGSNASMPLRGTGSEATPTTQPPPPGPWSSTSQAWQPEEKPGKPKDTAERMEALRVGGLSPAALRNLVQRHCLQILGNDEIRVSRGRI